MNGNRKNNKLILLTAILCLLSVGCTAPENPGATEEPKPTQEGYTLLIYMCGSSLESRNGAASDDIAELLEAEIPENANVILETGGAMTWKKYDIPNDKIRRYRVSGGELTLLREESLQSMGEASTLRDFIQWGTAEFPAGRTGLILWDHGGGFLEGVCRDEIYRNDWLTVAELDEALAASGFGEKFEFIGFDCCLMANYETALTAAKYAEHMIASEGEEPVGGWDYTALAEALGQEDFYGTVLDSFARANRERGGYTLSAMDLRQIGKAEAVLSRCMKKAGRSKFSRAIQAAQNFGAYQYDLGDIAACLEVPCDLTGFIQTVTDGGGAGLSICYPAANGEMLQQYLRLTGDEKYGKFLQKSAP